MKLLLIQLLQGRTGSTVLMETLAGAPDICFDRAYPFENRYLSYLLHILEPIGEPYKPGRDPNSDALLYGDVPLAAPLPFTPEILDITEFRRLAVLHSWLAFSDAVARRLGSSPQYYAEKVWGAPLDLLTSAQIDYRVVNLVRDPRDAVASIRAFDRKRGFRGFARGTVRGDDDYLSNIVREMREQFDRMLVTSDPAVAKLVRYEDLVTCREDVIADLSDWLGVEIASRPLMSKRTMRAHMTSESAESSIGRWRTDLSREDVRLLERELGHVISELNYA